MEFKNILEEQEPALSVFIILPTLSKFKKLKPIATKVHDFSKQYITYVVNEIVEAYTEKGYGELADENNSEGFCINVNSLEFNFTDLSVIEKLIKGYRLGVYDELIHDPNQP